MAALSFTVCRKTCLTSETILLCNCHSAHPFLPKNRSCFSSILHFLASKPLHNFQDQRYCCVKERQSLPVVNHYLIVFNTYAVFMDWKNGADVEKIGR